MKKPKITIKIITLFPQFIESFADSFGIVKKAVKGKLLEIKAINLRQFGLGERQIVDDRPYGGGVGMVLRPDVLYRAIQRSAQFPISNFQFPKKSKTKRSKARIILLTPQGQKFNQAAAKRLAKYDELVFITGRYEGFDERIRQFADEEISLGDYILMGGELPALVIAEAVMRLRPGILGKLESTANESFSEHLLEYPQYTKPEVWKVKRDKRREKSLRVPKVLLTGHHRNIEDWRKKEAEKRTKKRRPDLLKFKM